MYEGNSSDGNPCCGRVVGGAFDHHRVGVAYQYQTKNVRVDDVRSLTALELHPFLVTNYLGIVWCTLCSTMVLLELPLTYVFGDKLLLIILILVTTAKQAPVRSDISTRVNMCQPAVAISMNGLLPHHR